LDQRRYIQELLSLFPGSEKGALKRSVETQIKYLMSKIDDALQPLPARSAAASALPGQSAAPGAAGGPQAKK